VTNDHHYHSADSDIRRIAAVRVHAPQDRADLRGQQRQNRYLPHAAYLNLLICIKIFLLNACACSVGPPRRQDSQAIEI